MLQQPLKASIVLHSQQAEHTCTRGRTHMHNIQNTHVQHTEHVEHACTTVSSQGNAVCTTGVYSVACITCI